MMEEKEAADDKCREETQEEDEGGEGEGMRRCPEGQTGGFCDHEALWPHHFCVTNLKNIKI